MKRKLVLTITSIILMLGFAGCSESSSTKNISGGEILTSSGTEVCSQDDISGKSLQIAADTNYTITHNQDGTKEICITSGSVIIN